MYDSQKIRIVIIEDDETIRNGYAFLIGQAEGYDVVGTYPSYDEAAKKIVTNAPDVILLDINMPVKSMIIGFYFGFKKRNIKS